jgi:hypothetical protein
VALRLWGTRQPRVTVYGAVTTENVAAALAREPGRARAGAGRGLEPVHAALRTFTESQYGSGDTAADERLDEGLAAAERLGAAMAVERSVLGRITRQAKTLRFWLWSR